jgi:hypothetical protein
MLLLYHTNIHLFTTQQSTKTDVHESEAPLSSFESPPKRYCSKTFDFTQLIQPNFFTYSPFYRIKQAKKQIAARRVLQETKHDYNELEV